MVPPVLPRGFVVVDLLDDSEEVMTMKKAEDGGHQAHGCTDIFHAVLARLLQSPFVHLQFARSLLLDPHAPCPAPSPPFAGEGSGNHHIPLHILAVI